MPEKEITNKRVVFSVQNILKMLITIVVCVFGIGVVWSQTIQRVVAMQGDLDDKYDASQGAILESKVKSLEESYGALGAKIDNGFDRIDRKVDRLLMQ